MFRILNVQEAVRLCGWPADVEIAVPVDTESDNGGTWDQYLLEVKGGVGRITETHTAGEVRLTRRQPAVWYADRYRSAAAARLTGVAARSEEALSTLIRTTADHEPWLTDHF